MLESKDERSHIVSNHFIDTPLQDFLHLLSVEQVFEV